MPIIRAIIKPKAIFFLPFELELVQKYEIPNTTAMNTATGSINFIISSQIICIDIQNHLIYYFR